MRRIYLVCAPLLMAQTAPQPLVPEGIHQSATEQPHLCGFTAANVDALQQKVMRDPGFREENSDDHYRVFNRDRDFIQFVFSRPGFLSFPMATCITVTEAADGTSSIKRELHCSGTREECDRIFIEWSDHDNRIRRDMESQGQ